MTVAATRRRLHRASSLAVLVGVSALVAACATSGPTAETHSRSKEYFSEAEYGVKASPRVTSKRSRLPRLAGRDQVGDPYMVHGKWYYPKENRHYRAVGAASWYGDAFNGRLTANGEIYDMGRLTAAHPTMPLPSYARVTNMADGSSVVVRVNDRGPYAAGRIIDLSKRAAELLDYSTAGVAKVKVEYLGRAPLDAHDDDYLMASYRAPAGAPGNTMPSVMVAMDGPTPTSSPAAAVPFPGKLANVGVPAVLPAPRPRPTVQVASAAPTPAMANIFDDADPVLPAVGPIVPERPLVGLASYGDAELPVLGYADERVKRAAQAFDALIGAGKGMTPADVVASWQRVRTAPQQGDSGSYISVGTFFDASDGAREAHDLGAYGRAELIASSVAGEMRYSVNLYPDGRYPLDSMLERAWAHGDRDAMTVRE
jgi:rare lipoprotein A